MLYESQLIVLTWGGGQALWSWIAQSSGKPDPIYSPFPALPHSPLLGSSMFPFTGPGLALIMVMVLGRVLLGTRGSCLSEFSL